jgi:glycosyltransferase involved in cell wall biosynthesis
MNVLWIFPDTVNCGISIYSREYLNELQHHINIRHITPQSYIENKSKFLANANSSDIIHIQYETSFFSKKSSNFFLSLTKKINKPVLLTLHELYNDIPGVFPRDNIRGNFLLKPIKYFLYDFKHPTFAIFNKHIKNRFRADYIHVHYNYQKMLLVKKGIPAEKIEVVTHPVFIEYKKPTRSFKPSKTLRLGTIGFVNPNYDYDLLFSSLKLLDIPWTFTWTGGIRLPEHSTVLNRILCYITDNGWQDRFTITGWVSEDILNENLNNIDIYMAFFKSRSTSSSLTRAIGACKPIITTDLDLTRSIVKDNQNLTETDPIVIAESDPCTIVNIIKKINDNDHYREKLYQSVRAYAESIQLSNTSVKLISLYKKLLEK